MKAGARPQLERVVECYDEAISSHMMLPGRLLRSARNDVSFLVNLRLLM